MQAYLNDTVATQEVEVRVRADGKVVWLNVDGRCFARVYVDEGCVVVVADERVES